MNGRRGLGPYMTYFSDNPFVTGARDGVASVRFPDPANGPWLLVGLNTYGGGVSIDRLSTLLRDEAGRCRASWRFPTRRFTAPDVMVTARIRRST